MAFSSIESPQLPAPSTNSNIANDLNRIHRFLLAYPVLPIATLTSTPVIWAVWFSAMQLRCSIEASQPGPSSIVAWHFRVDLAPSQLFFPYTSLSLIIASRRRFFARVLSLSSSFPSTFSCFPRGERNSCTPG